MMLQFSNAEVPFGGVNNSGIGKSNGFFGFQEMMEEVGKNIQQELPITISGAFLLPVTRHPEFTWP